MTNLEAKQHLSRKLNLDYNDIANNDLFTDTDLQSFIQMGIFKAWDYKPWPFTQKVKKATSVSTEYYDHPTDIINGSIYRLTMGGEEYKKLDPQSYFKRFEDDSNAQNRIWTEVETYIFVNQNAYTVGDELCLFGKKFPTTLSGSSDLLPFSPTTDNFEHSGNEAIVLLAYGEALDSEKKKNPAQAEVERKKAYQILDVLWKPFAEQQALMQSAGRPMFEVPDFFGKGNKNDPAYIGNFRYLD
jgi:hypothetical protein